MSTIDRIRDRGFRAVAGLGGRVGKTARAVNDALGRPLAPQGVAPVVPPRPAAATPAPVVREPAPVCLYTLEDKRRGDVPRIREILDEAGIPYRILPLDDDPAGLAAVRRDSGGMKPPLVFIAGASVGGRLDLVNLGRHGLRKLVFG